MRDRSCFSLWWLLSSLPPNISSSLCCCCVLLLCAANSPLCVVTGGRTHTASEPFSPPPRGRPSALCDVSHSVLRQQHQPDGQRWCCWSSKPRPQLGSGCVRSTHKHTRMPHPKFSLQKKNTFSELPHPFVLLPVMTANQRPLVIAVHIVTSQWHHLDSWLHSTTN